MAEPEQMGEPLYRKLQNNLVSDVGLIYAGPHPCNVRHWLVLAAGLREMGTFAAARALHEPQIVEFIGRELLLRRRYISGLVRYHFIDADRERFQGTISSSCMTTGMVPES